MNFDLVKIFRDYELIAQNNNSWFSHIGSHIVFSHNIDFKDLHEIRLVEFATMLVAKRIYGKC